MTAAEIVDFVESKLKEQGQKSNLIVNGIDKCFYRVEKCGSVLKCAVGHLIPEKLYDPSMEAETVSSILDTFPALKPHLLPSDLPRYEGVAILKEIQHIHDFSPISSWPKAFAKLRAHINSTNHQSR